MSACWLQLFQALADERETAARRGPSRAIDLLTAFDQASACFRSGSPVFCDRLFQRRIAQLRLALRSNRRATCGMRDVDAAGLHLGPPPQPLERLDQRRKAVDPAALRVQIHELGRLAGVLAHALQAVVVDDVRE